MFTNAKNVHIGELCSQMPNMLTKDYYVHKCEKKCLHWRTMFTNAKYVHKGLLCSQMQKKFILENYVHKCQICKLKD